MSSDGKEWKFVECGRIFDTYEDSDHSVANYKKIINKFTKPVKARFVKILPEGWRNGPMMRAAVLVCEPECEKKHLKYEMQNSLTSSSGGPSLSSPWGDGSFETITSDWRQTVSGIVYDFYTARGGLLLKQSTCIKDNTEYTIIMQVQISNLNPNNWGALFTASGWNYEGLYVKDFFQLKPTNLVCDGLLLFKDYFYWLGMSRNKDGVVSLFVNGYKCATGKPTQNKGFELVSDDMIFFHGITADQTPQGHATTIRIWNRDVSEGDIQSLCGCRLASEGKSQCSDSVILNPSIDEYSASSISNGGVMVNNQYCQSPRLNSQYSWCPVSNQNAWLQMDTGAVQTITGVVTQGYKFANYWVQTFRVEVSADASVWKQVECGRIFAGNVDYDSKVKTFFSAPVEARYVRILPLTWYNAPMMRAGVLVCEMACDSGHLDYEMKTFRSSTGGPDLEAPWGEGDFIPFAQDDGFDYPYFDIKFYPDMPFDDCKDACNSDEKCGLVALYKNNGKGCWLKYGFGQDKGQGRRENRDRTMFFHIESLIYKLMAPVGYKFIAGQGLQLDEGNCIKTTDDYSILVDAMLVDVGSGLKRLISSKGWGDKGIYLNNKRIGLYPSSSGIQCAQSILPYYAFKFGLTRISDGEIKLYVNGLLCAHGFPPYADGFELNPHDIQFFYDSNTNYQEQGWIRRIQLWDDALSDKDMASHSGCRFQESTKSCKKGSIFRAQPSALDFSSTKSRDDFGKGFGQGQEVGSKPFRSIQEMRSAGETPPACPESKHGARVTLQRSCDAKNFFATKSGTFDEVSEYCKQNGGILATLSSEEDVQAAANACSGWCYIGLVRDRVNEPWRWLDGSSVSFTKWQGGQPQNTETKVVAWSGVDWNDWANGEAVFPGICETGADGWAGVTGVGIQGTLALPTGEYPSINGDGKCEDDEKLCVVQNCGFMSVSELSSFQVPFGMGITLYSQENFLGDTKTYVGPVSVSCLVADGWNDRARSLKIFEGRGDSSARDIGFWTPAPLPGQDNVWGIGEWMQVDLQTKHNISFVVTSGFRGYYRVGGTKQGTVDPTKYYNAQVTLFLLRYSNNARDWYDVECGRLFEVPWKNTPNSPVHSNLTNPIEARFIRLYPLAWQNEIVLKFQVLRNLNSSYSRC